MLKMGQIGPNWDRNGPENAQIQNLSKIKVCHIKLHLYGPKMTRKMAQKCPKISGMANLTPEIDSMPKITIETGLRAFYSQKNDPDASTFSFRLQSR